MLRHVSGSCECDVQVYDNSSSGCSELCRCRLNQTVICRALPCTPSVSCKHHSTVYGSTYLLIIIIIIIIRFYGLSKQLAFIAQLVAVHEFIQSGFEDLQ